LYAHAYEDELRRRREIAREIEESYPFAYDMDKKEEAKAQENERQKKWEANYDAFNKALKKAKATRVQSDLLAPLELFSL
jgi:hypothetical protein